MRTTRPAIPVSLLGSYRNRRSSVFAHRNSSTPAGAFCVCQGTGVTPLAERHRASRRALVLRANHSTARRCRAHSREPHGGTPRRRFVGGAAGSPLGDSRCHTRKSTTTTRDSTHGSPRHRRSRTRVGSRCSILRETCSSRTLSRSSLKANRSASRRRCRSTSTTSGSATRPDRSIAATKPSRMWNTDAYRFQESTDPLYKSIPFFLSYRAGNAAGVLIDNTWRSSFDFGKELADTLPFGAEDGPADYYIFYGPSPKQVVETMRG